MGSSCPINLLRFIKQNQTAGFFLVCNQLQYLFKKKKGNLITSYHKCTKRQVSRFPKKLNDLNFFSQQQRYSDYVTITKNILLYISIWL